MTQISWFMQSLLHAEATQNTPLNSLLCSNFGAGTQNERNFAFHKLTLNRL